MKLSTLFSALVIPTSTLHSMNNRVRLNEHWSCFSNQNKQLVMLFEPKQTAKRHCSSHAENTRSFSKHFLDVSCTSSCSSCSFFLFATFHQRSYHGESPVPSFRPSLRLHRSKENIWVFLGQPQSADGSSI